jgi:hypothetical protein
MNSRMLPNWTGKIKYLTQSTHDWKSFQHLRFPYLMEKHGKPVNKSLAYWIQNQQIIRELVAKKCHAGADAVVLSIL